SAQGASAGSLLVNGDLYLLTDISALGNTVHFAYSFGAPALPSGGTPLSIKLDSVSYKKSSATAGGYKNKIQLNYDAPAAPPPGSPPVAPLAMTTVNGTVLARVTKLTAVSVRSKASCGASDKALRDYAFSYQPDPDTQRPQLHAVTVSGREGT